METETNKLIVEHRETGKMQDSLTIGTPAKGGEIKVYGDYADTTSFRLKIDNAVAMRNYAHAKVEGAQ